MANSSRASSSTVPSASPSLIHNPWLDQRLSFASNRVVEVRTGKVELGQGILTALVQIAADELAVSPAQITIAQANTDSGPDEGLTVGSYSIETSGAAIRCACATARAMLVERAASLLDVTPAAVTVVDGCFMIDTRATQLDYWSVAPQCDFHRHVDATAQTDGVADTREPGPLARRLDLPAKVTGAAFIHDIEFPAMLHGRVVRPPSIGARLVQLDEQRLRCEMNLAVLLRDGDYLAVACEREEDAVRAAERVRSTAAWTAAERLPDLSDPAQWLANMPADTTEHIISEAARPNVPARTLSARYSRPPIAHASIGPSCALAFYDGGKLTIWSHSQGISLLRNAIAAVLEISTGDVTVIHAQGAGCYGHNGADDVALDAALLARAAPGRCIRVQWSREDELAWAPVGAPMAARIEAELDDEAHIVSWHYELWTPPNARRPWMGGAPNLLGATLLAAPTPLGRPFELPLPVGGGNRNAIAPYKLPCHRLTEHFIPDIPFRTSSLRSLGAHHNVFAIESFIDELADAAGADPIGMRLQHLDDPRGRAVIEQVAALANWTPGAETRGTGWGRGLAYSRYKNGGAYAAIIAEVVVEEHVRVTNVWCAADAGAIIHRDGALSQIEGGILQSLSWALIEAVRFDETGSATRSWADYPILGFEAVPAVHIELMANPHLPPLGVGEVAQGPATAAVANAVARALGLRIRDLPLTRDRILAAIG